MKTKVISGIEHGLSSYSNYGCRCRVCREANAERSRKRRLKDSMATIEERGKVPPKKTVIIQGVEHGLSAYTNYRCRCSVCRTANSEHSQEYRDRRFAGKPLCAVAGCPLPQSRSYGNHLCWSHAQSYLKFKESLSWTSRGDLKRLIRVYSLDIPVLKKYTDDELREAIIKKLGPIGLAEIGEEAA